jgi:hypothetical protein
VPNAQNKGAGEKALPGEQLPIDSGGFFCSLTGRAFLCQLPDDPHLRAGAKGVKNPSPADAGASLIRSKDSPQPLSPALYCDACRGGRKECRDIGEVNFNTDYRNYQDK